MEMGRKCGLEGDLLQFLRERKEDASLMYGCGMREIEKEWCREICRECVENM